MSIIFKKFPPSILICQNPQEKQNYLNQFFDKLNIQDPGLRSELTDICEIRLLPKKAHLLYENESCDLNYYILSGAIKLYRHAGGGIINIAAMFSDGSFCALNNPMEESYTSEYNLVSTEDTIVIAINLKKLHVLARRQRSAWNMISKQVSTTNAFFLERMISLQIHDASSKYDNLVRNHPEILRHFSLADIAAYLGIQPETLSRIRSASYSKAS